MKYLSLRWDFDPKVFPIKWRGFIWSIKTLPNSHFMCLMRYLGCYWALFQHVHNAQCYLATIWFPWWQIGVKSRLRLQEGSGTDWHLLDSGGWKRESAYVSLGFHIDRRGLQPRRCTRTPRHLMESSFCGEAGWVPAHWEAFISTLFLIRAQSSTNLSFCSVLIGIQAVLGLR